MFQKSFKTNAPCLQMFGTAMIQGEVIATYII